MPTHPLQPQAAGPPVAAGASQAPGLPCQLLPQEPGCDSSSAEPLGLAASTASTTTVPYSSGPHPNACAAPAVSGAGAPTAPSCSSAEGTPDPLAATPRARQQGLPHHPHQHHLRRTPPRRPPPFLPVVLAQPPKNGAGSDSSDGDDGGAAPPLLEVVRAPGLSQSPPLAAPASPSLPGHPSSPPTPTSSNPTYASTPQSPSTPPMQRPHSHSHPRSFAEGRQAQARQLGGGRPATCSSPAGPWGAATPQSQQLRTGRISSPSDSPR